MFEIFAFTYRPLAKTTCGIFGDLGILRGWAGFPVIYRTLFFRTLFFPHVVFISGDPRFPLGPCQPLVMARPDLAFT